MSAGPLAALGFEIAAERMKDKYICRKYTFFSMAQDVCGKIKDSTDEILETFCPLP